MSGPTCTCPEVDPVERATRYTVRHLGLEPHAVGCPRHGLPAHPGENPWEQRFPEMTEAGELRVRLRAVEHDLQHVAAERDAVLADRNRLRAQLADAMDANVQWQHRVVRVEALIPRIEELAAFEQEAERDAVPLLLVRDHLRRALDGDR